MNMNINPNAVFDELRAAVADTSTPAAVSHMITLTIDGRSITVPAGVTVIAAMAMAQPVPGAVPATRQSVSGQPRGPVCGMGICQECRVTIDGRPHQLACQSLCASGMDVLSTAGGVL